MDRETKILFITDIHQNLNGIQNIDFNGFDYILCGGDLLLPSNPDLEIAKKIIDYLPLQTYFVPGNCDKNNGLLKYVEKKIMNIHKSVHKNDLFTIVGVGYCRHLKEDMKVYRKYLLKDKERLFYFYRNSNISFLLNFCGITIENEKNIIVKSEEEALEASRDFINKFSFFDENEINDFFNGMHDLENVIFLSHSPPYGVLDKLDGLPHIGSKSILEGIKKIKPKLVLCGHFHELFGKFLLEGSLVFNPGAVKDNKYGIITINSNNIDVKIMNIR